MCALSDTLTVREVREMWRVTRNAVVFTATRVTSAGAIGGWGVAGRPRFGGRLLGSAARRARGGRLRSRRFFWESAAGPVALG